MANYNTERRWTTPSKRAASYVEERRAKVHQHGQKEGQPLSDYEAGLRSGYLQCQSDPRRICSATSRLWTPVFPNRKRRSIPEKRARSCRQKRAERNPHNREVNLWQRTTSR